MEHKRYTGERYADGGIVVVSDSGRFGATKRLLDPHHEVARFSDPPYDFDWGPGASERGVRQLAVAIICDAYEQDPLAAVIARGWHQVFADLQLATLAADGFTLSAWALRRWLNERRDPTHRHSLELLA